MRFYKTPEGWKSISDSHSKYWEIHKGFDKYKSVSITRPTIQGFGWGRKGNSIHKECLSHKKFKSYLEFVEKEFRYMLKQIKNLQENMKRRNNENYKI